MLDITAFIIGVSVAFLAWTVARINDKVDRHIKKFRRFEEALKKNASSRVKTNSTNHRKQPQDVYH